VKSKIDISELYGKVNASGKVEAVDADHIVWLLGSRSDSSRATVYADGRVEISSPDDFTLKSKTKLDKELDGVLLLLKGKRNKLSDKDRAAVTASSEYLRDGLQIDAKTWSSIGNELSAARNYGGALMCYNRSVGADPGFAEGWNNLGAAARMMGRTAEAMKGFDLAINQSPKAAEPLANKGELLNNLGKYKEAMDNLNGSIELDSGIVSSHNSRGVVLSNMGRYQEALDNFNRSIALDVYSSIAWNNKGVAFAKSGDLPDAVESFNKALTLDIRYKEAWHNAGLALRDLNQTNRSRISFDEAAALGYNVNSTAYNMKTYPVFMGAGAKKERGIPGFEAPLFFASVVAVAFVLTREALSRRRYKD
jgi:tetratricopeptide (TPR) repeat protein